MLIYFAIGVCCAGWQGWLIVVMEEPREDPGISLLNLALLLALVLAWPIVCPLTFFFEPKLELDWHDCFFDPDYTGVDFLIVSRHLSRSSARLSKWWSLHT